MIKRASIILLLPALILSCGAPAAPAPVYQTRLLLNTFCTITIYDPPEPELIAAAMELCAEYEALFSITIEGSDVWRINHAGGAPVTVAPETAAVIMDGLHYGEISGGMFDITIGRVSTLWDFSGGGTIPGESELADALETVDYRQVSVTGNTVRLAHPGAWIDLGGIAKGYIADQIAGFLTGQGVRAAVIDLGGNVVTIGEKPDGSPWRIGVRDPSGEYDRRLGILETGAASVVTSGIYERKFEREGAIYHHILDPRTGMPVRTDLVSATVLTDDSMTGDILSTVMLLLGVEKAMQAIHLFPGFTGAVLLQEDGELILLGDVVFI